MLLIWLACTSPKDQVASDSSSSTDDSDDSDTLLVPSDACVSGVARDFDNIGAPYAQLKAWDPSDCSLLAEGTADVGGVFCIAVPKETTFELQVLYEPAERCAWWHGHTVTSLGLGDCLDSGSSGPCVELGTLFECEAETAICSAD